MRTTEYTEDRFSNPTKVLKYLVSVVFQCSLVNLQRTAMAGLLAGTKQHQYHWHDGFLVQPGSKLIFVALNMSINCPHKAHNAR